MGKSEEARRSSPQIRWTSSMTFQILLGQVTPHFSRYKAELLEDGVFEDVNQARTETFSYIEGYYYRIRRHSALGYKSPAEFEREINTKKKGSRSESLVCGIT